ADLSDKSVGSSFDESNCHRYRPPGIINSKIRIPPPCAPSLLSLMRRLDVRLELLGGALQRCYARGTEPSSRLKLNRRRRVLSGLPNFRLARHPDFMKLPILRLVS